MSIQKRIGNKYWKGSVEQNSNREHLSYNNLQQKMRLDSQKRKINPSSCVNVCNSIDYTNQDEDSRTKYLR